MKTLCVSIRAAPVVMSTMRFQKFPVRIGRDPACECRVDLGFLSRFHARLDVREGRLVLRDDASRAGLRRFKDKKALPPNAWIDLATIENEFCIGPILFRAELLEGEAQSGAHDFDRRELAMASAADFDNATAVYASANVSPEELDAAAFRAALRESLEKHRQAGDALSGLLTQASLMPGERLREIAQDIVNEYPEWGEHSSLRRFIEESGFMPTPARLQTTALRSLEQLSRRYVPSAPPLTNTEAVVAFVERLDQVLLTLIEGTAALRYVYLSEVELDAPGDPQRADLAACLLDWTTDSSVLDAIRDDLTRMLAHHRRLVTDAVNGLERALALLRPPRIENDCISTSGWHPMRYRHLWKEFVHRYERLARERSLPLGRTIATAAEGLGLERTSAASGIQDVSPRREHPIVAGLVALSRRTTSPLPLCP